MLLRILLGLKHVGGCATCHEQQSVELKLAFHAELLHSEIDGLPDRSTKICRPIRTPRSSPLPISSSRDVPPNQSLPSPSISPRTTRWVADEFKVFLHQILQELELGLLQATNDLRASLDLLLYNHGVFLLGERTTCRRLPDVLFIVIILADDTNLVRNQMCHIETDAELF